MSSIQKKGSNNLDAVAARRKRAKIFVTLAIVFFIIILYVAMQMANWRNSTQDPDAYNFFRSIIPTIKSIPQYPFSLFGDLFGRYTGDTFLWWGMIYLFTTLLLYLDEVRHVHDLSGSECGSAKWNNDLKGFRKQYSDVEASKTTLLSKNVSLAMNTYQTQRNNNVLVVGGSGAGKSRGFVKPNILQQNCNMVITDPSGELIESTGKFLKDNDYTIKVFNLVQKDKSNCYNPFHYIRDEAGVMMMINCLITNTTPPEQHSGDPFWEKSETLLLMALCFYLWQHRPVEEQNFGTVLKLLRMSDVDEKNDSYESFLDRIFLKSKRPRMGGVKINGQVVDTRTGEILNDGYNDYVSRTTYVDKQGNVVTNSQFLSLEELDVNGTDIAVNQYKAFKKGAGKTAKSILISCMVRLQAFNIPQIYNLTCKDDIHLEAMGGTDPNKKKQALFVIIPAADNTYNFLVSMMYSQLFETLYYVAETDPVCVKQKLPVHVRFLLDEFANIGQIPQFTEKLSTMRKYEISCSVILQNLAQIKKAYKDDWESIIGNSDTFIFLGGKEYTTLEYISKELGDQTITSKDRSTNEKQKSAGASQSYKQSSRKLMNPDELGNIPNNKCVVMVRGLDPFYDDKIVYTDHPNYAATGDYDHANNYVITLNNAIGDGEDMEIRAQQLRSKAYQKVEKIISIDSMIASKPEWIDYPNVYATFKVIEFDSEEEEVPDPKRIEDPDADTSSVVTDKSNDVTPETDVTDNVAGNEIDHENNGLETNTEQPENAESTENDEPSKDLVEDIIVERDAQAKKIAALFNNKGRENATDVTDATENTEKSTIRSGVAGAPKGGYFDNDDDET